MGLLDSLLGRTDDRAAAPAPADSPDARAVERYRYLLRTAPPETLEQAHAEAFSRLTADQRRMVLGKLAAGTPANERAAAAATSPDDPQAMGRLATRVELREPGFMERTFGGGGFGGSLLASFAMGFVGSMVAQSFLSSMAEGGAAPDDGSAGDADGIADAGDPDVDFDGGDFGGDF